MSSSSDRLWAGRRLACPLVVRSRISRHLRHTSVTLMLAAGIPVHVVASVHGHDPLITQRIYAHTRQDDAIAAMATLDRIIGRAAAIEPPGL